MPNAPQASVHRDSSRVIRLEEVTRVDKQTFSHWNMSACLLYPPHEHTSENGSYCQRGWIEWNPVNSFSTICLNFDGNVNNSHLNLKRIHWHWQVVIAIIAIIAIAVSWAFVAIDWQLVVHFLRQQTSKLLQLLRMKPGSFVWVSDDSKRRWFVRTSRGSLQAADS